MDIFGDKRYENLDWITKATEPYVYALNETLASLPDSYDITIEDAGHIVAMTGEWGLRSIRSESFLAHLLPKWLNNAALNQERMVNLIRCYVFEIEDKPVIDFNQKAITGGRLILKKFKERFDEDEIKKHIGQEGNVLLKTLNRNNANLERAHEILDLLGGKSAEKGLKKRSISGKLLYIREAYSKIMYANTWNIRNVELSLDIAKWICEYIEHGNLEAMTKFCRLKAITHRGYPIYNIEEET